MKKLHVGLIGLGTISNMHYHAIEASSRMELVAICTRSEENLRRHAEQWKIDSAYTDYRELLRDPKIDAVIIATPPSTHAPIALEAISAGKHVFCEKPPALDASQAAAMAEAAEKAGVVLMYGFMFRFSNKHSYIKEVCDSGMLGEIYYAKAGIVNRYAPHDGWFTNKAVSGGGPLMDYGPHIIDLCIYLMGEHSPKTVFARSFRAVENMDGLQHAAGGYQAIDATKQVNDVEEMDVAMITFDNGACLHVETSFNSHIKEDGMSIELLGSKGGMQVDPEMEIHTVLNNTLVDIIPRVNCESYDYGRSIDDELDHFATCAQEGVPCRAGGKVGLRLMQIVEAAYRSAATGISVDIVEL